MVHYEGWTFLDAVRFMCVSISTTGYGDFVPSTPGTRIFTGFMLLAGSVIYATVIGSFAGLLKTPSKSTLLNVHVGFLTRQVILMILMLTVT